MISSNFANFTSATLATVEQYIAGCIPRSPASLYEPVRKTLQNGGKRIRPLLTALIANLGSSDQHWVPAAAAVELLHTFTLLHDDIMDNAMTRRGKPTTHVEYGVNSAILSGDVIIALATETLAEAEQDARLLSEFACGFRAVCEGQALDKEFETREQITVEEYLDMIDLKTAKVIELAAVLGAICGRVENIERIRTFAHHLGMAFQIRDDVLDLTADHAAFGKTIGGDILEGKRTILFAIAQSRYDRFSHEEKDLFDRIRARQAVVSDIALSRSAFERTGVLQAAAELALEHTDLAKATLAELPESEARAYLLNFAESLLGRIS